MFKKAGLLTRPTPARRDAPFPKQGRSSAADPRFTFHASRFTVPGSEARTPLTDFFSILLEVRLLRRIRRRSRGRFPEARMPHPAERNKGMIQINKWLGECRRWPLLCTVLLLTVLLVTAGSEADVTII